MQHPLTRVFSFLLLSVMTVCCNTERRNGEMKEEVFDSLRLVKIPLISTGLDEPMEIAITGAGRVIVIERKGNIRIYEPSTNKTRLIASLPVFSGLEDGLLGLALDPGYDKNNFIYLFYSPIGDKAIQRVSRFWLQEDSFALNSEKVLIEIPTQRKECCHSAGSLAFGPNGNLFIAVGDNTNPHNPGYYNSIDERKGREYWDAQRTAGNTNDLRGKILRIHPEPDGTYTIPKGNLFPPGMANTKPEIYVMGCRNPYRIAVDIKNGWLYWGDVGQNTIDNPSRGPISYDEFHLAREAGFYGWPYFAGPNSPYADFNFETEKIGPFFDPEKPINNSVNNTGLKELPKAREALIWYSYDESKLFPHLGTGGKSPIGGPVYYTELYKNKLNDTTRHLHEHYNGKVFIAEWMRDWINVLTINKEGKIETIEPFMKGTKFNHPVDIEIGPDGILYVLEYGTNWFVKNKDAGLYKIEYQRGNRPPVVHVQASQVTGALPMTVQFTSNGTHDPDSSQVKYKWFFDNKTVQSTDPVASYTFNQAGVYNVKLQVEDSDGKVQEKTIEIRAGNAEPQITFNVKDGNKSFYWPGTPINYSIDVTDLEDGSLQKRDIPANEVKISLAYTTMGTDLAMVAQSHESITATEPDFEPIKKSDCKACHAMNEKSVGPSYMSIATRYKNDSTTIKKLSAKIISGGAGVWGEHAMSAHPQLSEKEAADMASFILSLKDEATQTRSIPASGRIIPGSEKGIKGGDYILSVTYNDREQASVGSNSTRRNFFIRNPLVQAASADTIIGGVKTQEAAVRFDASKSWLVFKNIDLTGIRSITVDVDSIGTAGVLSVNVDQFGENEIASVDLFNKKLKQIPIKISPIIGVHDLYITYITTDSTAVGSRLFLRNLTFNR